VYLYSVVYKRRGSKLLSMTLTDIIRNDFVTKCCHLLPYYFANILLMMSTKQHYLMTTFKNYNDNKLWQNSVRWIFWTYFACKLLMRILCQYFNVFLCRKCQHSYEKVCMIVWSETFWYWRHRIHLWLMWYKII